MSAAAASSLMKPIPVAKLQVNSLPTLFAAKTHYPFLSLLSKPVKLSHLSFSFSSSPLSWVPQKSKFSQFVAQKSAWAQQDEEEGKEEGFMSQGESGDEDGGSESLGDEASEGDGDSYPEPPEDAKLFVGNLPFDVGAETLAQLFNQAGVVEAAEVKYSRPTNRSRGFGFVSMSTVEQADKAVEMFSGYDLNGRILVVNKAVPIGSRPELERSRMHEPSFKLYVGNLSWEVDAARLEQIFSEHGKVVDARVIFDRGTGRSRGFGFVTMSTETELNDAIAALHGQTLDGRTIRVTVADRQPRGDSR